MNATHHEVTGMTTPVQLDAITDQRLDQLVAQTGRTKAYFLRELAQRGIEALENYYLAAQVVERVRKGQEVVHTTAQVRADLGLDN
jgi:RHH-type rel operon transcriptional repressor/antitoxin RelB